LDIDNYTKRKERRNYGLSKRGWDGERGKAKVKNKGF